MENNIQKAQECLDQVHSVAAPEIGVAYANMASAYASIAIVERLDKLIAMQEEALRLEM